MNQPTLLPRRLLASLLACLLGGAEAVLMAPTCWANTTGYPERFSYDTITPLNFGTIATSGAGSITVSEHGGASTAGGLHLFNYHEVTPALFRITTQRPNSQGQFSAFDPIMTAVFPDHVTLANRSGLGSVTLSHMTSSFALDARPPANRKDVLLSIGARLTINNGEALGSYQGEIPVLIIYNNP